MNSQNRPFDIYLNQGRLVCRIRAVGWGNCLKYLKRGWNKEEGRGNKDFKKGASWVKEGCLENKGSWNPLTNYDNPNYKLYKCWMYILSWGYSPVSHFDILYLARDSLLKHLCCYFLLLLVSRLLASLLCVCKNSIKSPSYSMPSPHFRCAFFFYHLLRLLFIDNQMKSQVLPLKLSR